jgi:hypothetical protein
MLHKVPFNITYLGNTEKQQKITLPDFGGFGIEFSP